MKSFNEWMKGLSNQEQYVVSLTYIKQPKRYFTGYEHGTVQTSENPSDAVIFNSYEEAKKAVDDMGYGNALDLHKKIPKELHSKYSSASIEQI